MCWSRWCASRWSPSSRPVATPASACWRRSASSPRNDWRHRHQRRGAGSSRPLLRRAGRRLVGAVGGARLRRRGGVDGRRVRQPARRVPLGRRPRRPRDRDGDRRPHDDAWFPRSTLRARLVGRRNPRRRRAADVEQLPRLFTAAGICIWTGHPEMGLAYAHTATALADDPRYDGFPRGTHSSSKRPRLCRSSRPFRGNLRRLAPEPGFAHVHGLSGLIYMLPTVGRAEEARTIIAETLAAARAHGNPDWIVWAMAGRTGSRRRPIRPALSTPFARPRLSAEHRIPYFEGSSPGTPPRSKPSTAPPRGPGAVRHRDRFVPPNRKHRPRGLHPRRAGGVLRPQRATRDRRHPLRHQHRYGTASVVIDFAETSTTCALCSATPSSTSVSPSGRRWNRPTPCITRAPDSTARSSWGPRRERPVAAVGDGDVSVHRYRGFDASLGVRL